MRNGGSIDDESFVYGTTADAESKSESVPIQQESATRTNTLEALGRQEQLNSPLDQTYCFSQAAAAQLQQSKRWRQRLQMGNNGLAAPVMNEA